MDWYCLIFNSEELNGPIAAQYVYEQICQGDFSSVGDINLIDDLYKELEKKNLPITIDKGPGFIVVGAPITTASSIHVIVSSLCKTFNLSYFEPQNMTYYF